MFSAKEVKEKWIGEQLFLISKYNSCTGNVKLVFWSAFFEISIFFIVNPIGFLFMLDVS